MPLTIETVTVKEVQSLTSLWFSAFRDPSINFLWPDTPLVRAWWDSAISLDLQKSTVRLVKVVDPDTLDADGRPRLVAYAKWDTAMPDERGQRYPPWCADMPAAKCDAFFEREERERRRVMGDEKHYYLDTIATHPDYQRRGAGSMLLQWGCDLADANGVSAYVDASKDGAKLYMKFGFVDVTEDESDVASMVRRRKTK